MYFAGKKASFWIIIFSSINRYLNEFFLSQTSQVNLNLLNISKTTTKLCFFQRDNFDFHTNYSTEWKLNQIYKCKCWWCHVHLQCTLTYCAEYQHMLRLGHNWAQIRASMRCVTAGSPVFSGCIEICICLQQIVLIWRVVNVLLHCYWNNVQIACSPMYFSNKWFRMNFSPIFFRNALHVWQKWSSLLSPTNIQRNFFFQNN